MTSDFAAAHLHLERACHYLRGDDETSSAARAALDILIDAIAAAQYKRHAGGRSGISQNGKAALVGEL